MSPLQIVILLLLFILVSGLTWTLIGLAVSLRPMVAAGLRGDPDFIRRETVQQMLGLSERLSPVLRPMTPDSASNLDWRASPLRLKLIRAGFRGPSAVPIYFVSKLLSAGFLAMLAILGSSLAKWNLPAALVGLVTAVALGLGFYLPDLLLRSRTTERQQRIMEQLPDSLDLMRICLEAGLGLDAAILRVSQEFKNVCPPIYQELHTITLELRAGSSRNDALRHFAVRTGLQQVNALVSTLIQSDRFGTGIADAIRIHAEHLRSERRLKAEEAASKIATKLLFPLIFCIFPALLLVLVGPAGITVQQHLSPENPSR